MAGEVERLVSARPSDYPLMLAYPSHPGGMYERDLDGGTVATYVWRSVPAVAAGEQAPREGA